MHLLHGEFLHNSYLVDPTPEQLAGVPTIATSATKWAKGKLILGEPGVGRLEFRPGLELKVTYTIVEEMGQLIFRAQGTGEAAPLTGVIYHLLGWAQLDANGEIHEVAGGIMGAKGSDLAPPPNDGLAGQPPGRVGYFKLQRI